MKIMIVDDNKRMREVIKSVLSSPGVTFFECEDGGKAVSSYSVFKPDLVLMDISMSSVDGISATNELQAMFPESRIIMLTEYGDEQLRSKAQEAGAYAYVLKENVHELPIIINSILI